MRLQDIAKRGGDGGQGLKVLSDSELAQLHQVLLQILDDGRITDARGKTVNFENTVIVMTTNAGSDRTAALAGFSAEE